MFVNIRFAWFTSQIDDIEDIDVIELLIDPETPEGFDVVTTETVPGLPIDSLRRRPNLQAFNRVWKGKIPTVHAARHLNRCFEMILRVRTFLNTLFSFGG